MHVMKDTMIREQCSYVDCKSAKEAREVQRAGHSAICTHSGFHGIRHSVLELHCARGCRDCMTLRLQSVTQHYQTKELWKLHSIQQKKPCPHEI